MGGVRHAPGPIVSERIVHVDSPEIVERHKRMADEAIAAAKEQAEQAIQAIHTMRAEKHALEKRLAEVSMDRERIANQKATDGIAVSIGPGTQEIERLKNQAVKLREELAAAYKLAHATQKIASAEPVIQFVDREVMKEVTKVKRVVDKKKTLGIAVMAFWLGLAIGSFLVPALFSHAPVQVEQKVKATK